MNLTDHMERYLGPITEGWKDKSKEHDFNIVVFSDCPSETVSTFCSLGLSNITLDLSVSRKIRQELVFTTYSDVDVDIVRSLLMSTCEAIAERGIGVLRGEVIPLSVELTKKVGFQAIYCGDPVLFSEGFRVFRATSPPTVVVWAMPIFQNEADFVSVNGWRCFEKLLEKSDPDFCFLERDSIV